MRQRIEVSVRVASNCRHIVACNQRSVGSQSQVRRRHVGQVIVASSQGHRSAHLAACLVQHAIGAVGQRTQQWVSSELVDRGSAHRRIDLWEVHEVTTAGTAHSLHSSRSARECGGFRHVDDVPVTHQTAGGGVETHVGCIRFEDVVFQSDVCQRGLGSRTSHRARSHGVHVLDGSEQSGLGSLAAHGVDLVRRNVSHVEDFNIAFAGAAGLGFVCVVRIQTAGGERLWGVEAQRRHRAGVVSSLHLGNAVSTGCHSSSPHVARRHEDLEVHHVVRVGGAAEANLHSLTVHGVGVDHVQHGHVVVLGAVVRHQQHVTHTTFRQSQIASCCHRHTAGVITLDPQTIQVHRLFSICHTARTRNQVSRCCADKAQATNHGSNAQGQNIFLHIETPVKKLVSATTTIDYAREW